MGIIDDHWEKKVTVNSGGKADAVKVISEDMLEMLKEAYVEGWVDCDKFRPDPEEKPENSVQQTHDAIALVERLAAREPGYWKSKDTDIYECIIEAKKIAQQHHA